MSTKHQMERPRMKLAALRERTKLRAVVKDAEKRIRELRQQADQENGLAGLLACRRFNAVLVVEEIRPYGYIGGALETNPDRNYYLQKEFGQEHYHFSEGFKVDGIAFNLRGDDGRLQLDISLPDCEVTDKTDLRSRAVRNAEALPSRVEALGRILKKYGIPVSASAVESKRDELKRELDAQIALVTLANQLTP